MTDGTITGGKWRDTGRHAAGRLRAAGRAQNWGTCLALAALLVWSWVSPVLAHGLLRESVPAAHATVKGPVVEIRIRFTSRLDLKRSRLLLHRPGVLDLPLQLLNVEEPATLAAITPGLKPGPYVLRWQTLALDGHITKGEIPFNVGR